MHPFPLRKPGISYCLQLGTAFSLDSSYGPLVIFSEQCKGFVGIEGRRHSRVQLGNRSGVRHGHTNVPPITTCHVPM